MSKEIKQKIDNYNKKIERLFDPTSFSLNPEISRLSKEILKLQHQCKHHFINGTCEFCYMEEK